MAKWRNSCIDMQSHTTNGTVFNVFSIFHMNDARVSTEYDTQIAPEPGTHNTIRLYILTVYILELVFPEQTAW